MFAQGEPEPPSRIDVNRTRLVRLDKNAWCGTDKIGDLTKLVIYMAILAGDQMRDSIATLLGIKFKVEKEKRLKATTADVFFVDDTNAIFPRKIAVESKDWKKRLSSEDLASIYNLYAPSLHQREIDFLWIVGRHPLLSSPKLSLDGMDNVRYSTFDEFRASLMNFNALLTNNALVFEHDDASKYFVKTRVRNAETTLYEHVMNWLQQDQPGLIVYGGYGLGKTTFSLQLASILSERYGSRSK